MQTSHDPFAVGGADTMSIYKETAIAVAVLSLLLFAGHSFFAPDDSYRHLTTNTRSWLGGVEIPAERFIAKDLITGGASGADEDPSSLGQKRVSDLTPEARIRSVFAQFELGGRRRAT
jgi:hypothetical protein